MQDRQLDRLDSGPRWLTDPRIADVFAEALLHGERARHEYDLYAWVVMPHHVHLVLKPNGKLSESMRWLKTATASRANQSLGKTGEAFWQREYYDRWSRSDKELAAVVAYVERHRRRDRRRSRTKCRNSRHRPSAYAAVSKPLNF